MTKPAYTYVKATLVATSPLKLSSGAEQLSDADVLVDATGKAFIPGTTLAGVMRHYVKAMRKQEGKEAKDYVDEWFGHIVPNKDEGSESLIRVYDAYPLGDAPVSSRDGVRLTGNKTADSQGKFDYQVVDAGSSFELRMRLSCMGKTKDESNDLVSCVLLGFAAGEIMVGGKTSRGFGKFEVRNAKTLHVDLANAEDVRRYIGFDWDKSAFEPLTLGNASQVLYDEAEEVRLELVSPLIIRDYATVARSGHKNKLVDAQTLTNREHDPVIPGTSWAGAFRHHMHWILTIAGYESQNQKGETADAFLNRVFGVVDGGRGVASQIEFCETTLAGSAAINYTRTAIDRFTGGAADQMLFTNRIAYGGTTTLRIRWRSDMDADDKQLLKTLVRTCINDLYNGVLAVGGMTATGCGVFRKGDANGDGVTA